jgi:hypothetical protein
VIELGSVDAPGVTELGPQLRELNDQVAKIETTLAKLENEPAPEIGQLDITPEEAA